MALDLEDQEQLDELKIWWDKYGKQLINTVLVLVIAYAAWQGYQYFEQKKTIEASDIYQKLVESDPTDTELVKAEGAKLMNDYASTPYAGRAAVMLAKSSFKGDDIASAKSQLEWAADNAQETSVKAIANLQLATLLLGEKDYAGAEKLLTQEIDSGYLGIKDSLLGDIHVAQGKTDEAKIAYQSALEHLDAEGRLHLFTQQKLDSLGS